MNLASRPSGSIVVRGFCATLGWALVAAGIYVYVAFFVFLAGRLTQHV